LINISAENGINLPETGNSSNSTVIPGVLKFGSFSWKRSLFLFGGITRRTVDLVMSFTLCSENQVYDGKECITCPFGKVASNETFKTFESCESVCISGSVWNGKECLNCSSGRYSNQALGACSFCPAGSFSDGAELNSICKKVYLENLVKMKVVQAAWNANLVVPIW
jgi:hypothetical protein